VGSRSTRDDLPPGDRDDLPPGDRDDLPPGDDVGADDCDDHIAWAINEWPDIDPDVEAIVSRVSTVDRIVDRAAVDTLESLGLAHGDLKVLLRLSRGRMAHGEIARRLLVSTGTMTNRLDKLEKSGLVERHSDPNDRRGVLVELTNEGRATLDRYIAIQAKRERQMLSGMSRADMQQLSGLLRKLVSTLEAESHLVKR